MTMASAYDKAAIYRSQSVGTAGPAQLVMMLFDGALAAVAKAERALTEGDLGDSHDSLVLAQEIIAELAASLDVARGGEVARSFSALYDFCQRGLIAANVRKSAEPLAAVVQVITELKAGWSGAMAETVA